MADFFHPETSPYDTGFLDVGDGNRIYYEQLGNPEGKPAVSLHGGPGTGGSHRPTRFWDPQAYRVVRFDQRNCGYSTPHASNPAADMSVNTTEHALSDMERLREHLGIKKWLVNGGSWGATLALLYAQRHPDRVSEMVIPAVTMTRPEELDWLYRGVRRIFPEAWERFRRGVPEAERDGNLLAAYSRLMEHPDRSVREQAAADWLAWEDAVISLEPNGAPHSADGTIDDTLLAFVRICAHYYSHGAWLAPDQVLRDVGKLAGIPAVLIHGRQDLGCPVQTAWELSQAWPDARLVVVEDAGHTGSTAMSRAVIEAIDGFAAR
ncbi:proline iminopeptidase [Catenulispora sp. EB89]|uniref:prolyl aminopeptidase n=1 Tax=Catenulispora sp. EB89 TaxID=3156257 RepID=UPI003511D042